VQMEAESGKYLRLDWQFAYFFRPRFIRCANANSKVV